MRDEPESYEDGHQKRVSAGAGGGAVPAGVQPGFGVRLRAARVGRGLTQAELAGPGLSSSYLSLIEAGKREPTEQVARRVAEQLEVDVDHLLTGVDPQDAVQARIDLALARLALEEGRFATAAALVEPLVERPPAGLGERESFESSHVLATARERAGDLRSAVGLLEDLRLRAERSAGELPWLPVVVNLARCYRDAGDSARAVDVAEAALRRCEELGLSGVDGHTQLMSTLAGVYADRGDLLRAAHLLDELLDPLQGQDNQQRGYVYWNAAMTAAECGQRGESLRLIERAAALLADGDDERNQARIKVARAWIMLSQEDADAAAARALLRDALPALRRSAGVESVAKAETELARAEILLGRPQVARRHARRALSRLREDQPLSAARARAALGASLLAEGDVPGGTEQLHQAAALLSLANAPREASALWRQLSQAYRGLGDTQRALEAMDRALDAVGVVNASLPLAAQDLPRSTPGQVGAPV